MVRLHDARRRRLEMSKREVVAYAITHAGRTPEGKAIRGGPYEAIEGDMGDTCTDLRGALRWPTSEDGNKLEEARKFLKEDVLPVIPHARVIRIVRARPSEGREASAVEVLRELVAWDDDPPTCTLNDIFARARRVLAASGPDPMPVVRAAEKRRDAHADYLKAAEEDRLGRVGSRTNSAYARWINAENDEDGAIDELRRKTSWRDAALTLDGELKNALARAEKAELGRDELTAMLVKLFDWEDTSFMHAVLHVENAVLNQRADLSAETRRAEKAERERDGVQLLHREAVARADAAEARVHELTAANGGLRISLARLTAPGDGEPTPGQLLDACPPSGGVERLLACYRLGVAHERARVSAFLLREAADYDADGTITCSGMALRQAVADLGGDSSAQAHERARQQPAQGRATDEELVAIASKVYHAAGVSDWGDARNLECVRAVAARVRKECLVAQAVASGAEDVVLYRERRGGTTWGVRVDERGAVMQAPADVPATLARLLGEVAR